MSSLRRRRAKAATHNDLFAVIGTTFGIGNGTTTFNVPDLRGRVTAGLDGSAGRLTSQPGGINGDAVGNVGGAEAHTLAVDEMPSHSHSSSARSTFGQDRVGTGNFQVAIAGSSTGSAGGGGAHNNVQPTMIVNKIIFHGVF